MSGAKAKSWWVLGRGGLVVGLVLGMGLAGTTSCLGPNTGHCLYAGGDLECGSSKICVFAPTGGEAEGVGADGCFDGADPPSGFFHAKYGLPARLRAERDPMDVASVEGLLRRLDDCDENVSEYLASFENDPELDATVRCVMDIRRKLTTEGGVLKADYKVDVDEGESDECVPAMMEGVVKRYYGEIDALCPEMPSDTSTSTSTESVGNTTDETTSSSGSTTEPECPDECPDPESPVCDPATGMCVPCDDMQMSVMACADVYPESPLCAEGRCVQCTAALPMVCTTLGLVCDVASGKCVPCTAHAQCGEAACNLFDGTCLPGEAEAIAHVGPEQASATLEDGILSIPKGGEGTVIVHQADFNEAVVVDGNRTVAFLAAEGDSPVWAFIAGGAPQLEVTEGSTILMDGLQVSDGDLGLRVNGGRAWVDRSRIIQNSGGGIVAEAGAELVLRNSFVVLNGGQFVDTRGITVTGSTLDVRYATVVANDGTGASGPVSMSCDAASTGEVRNSIVAAGDDTIACTNVSFSFSVVDTAGLMGSDTDVLSFQPAWFPNIAMSDFHIAMGPPFANVSQWTTGDPSIDIDGDARPAVDGSPDYAGADVPQ